MATDEPTIDSGTEDSSLQGNIWYAEQPSLRAAHSMVSLLRLQGN